MEWTDEKLMAWLDGELPPAEAERVARAVADDPLLAEKADAQRRLKERLGAHFAPVAEEPVPERLRALLEPEEGAAEIVSLEAERGKRRGDALPRRWGWPQFGAMAASLGAGLLAGQAMLGGGADGAPALTAPVAQALDAQLASAQPADAPVRIGLTFRDGAGDWCRTFEAPDMSGLACNRAGEWRLAMAVLAGEGSGASTFRQAGSPAVLGYAAELMADAPADAEAERAARDGGWR